MADESSPRPFRRERNLSNRNFEKRGSRRRFSTESHSSIDSLSTATESNDTNNAVTATSTLPTTSSSSSLQYSYSVNSDTENAFNQKSLHKMRPPSTGSVDIDINLTHHHHHHHEEPQTPDPALMDVKQKLLLFEKMQADERIIFKTGKFKSKSLRSLTSNEQLSPLRVLPMLNRRKLNGGDVIAPNKSPMLQATSVKFHTSIDEERSEDEVDDFSDYAEDESATNAGDEYVIPEEAHELKEGIAPSPEPGCTDTVDEALSANVVELSLDDFGKVEAVRQSSTSSGKESAQVISHSSEVVIEANGAKKGAQDFPRNYRSTPRPKTEIVGTTNRHLIGKFNSVYHAKDDEEEEEIELRDKCDKFIHPILEELIKTEETYVENLVMGIQNYGNIFQRRDLPIGLRGKKYVLLGNIEQIAEFHRDEFLPMLLRNRRDLKRLFDEFQLFIDQNCFYGYVIFTMNKQKSLKLCDVYKNYFKLIQTELDDKLGINSFLVQPIQRMARYPLLLQQFISTLFKNRDYVMKPLIESCCRLEKKLRTLLTTTNESEVINDIVDCHEFNVFYQGKFRKVSEFNVFDHTLKRSYRSKVFIFDKCIIYAEIKGKNLVFHGRYPCEHIGILAKTKTFTLFYERRKQQECDFHGDPALIEMWLELIRDMINSYVTEERLKLQERYSRETDHLHRKPPSLALFRDSNRFSSDSGIGNIWALPNKDMDDTSSTASVQSNRTTWYAIS